MKILIVDDHDMIRDGLSMLLQKKFKEITILEAKTLKNALEHLSNHQDIDAIMLDLHLQLSSPLENIEAIKKNIKQSYLCIISAEERPEFIRNILSYDIQAYIPKSLENHLFIEAIEHVLQGKCYLPPQIEKELKISEDNEIPALHQLSQRQKQVLSLLAKGLSNCEISQRLQLSETTIQVHVRNILRIMNAANRTEASYLATKYGII